MRKLFSIHRIRILAANAIVLTSVALYFQNCSKVKFVDGVESLSSESGGNTSNKSGRMQIINPSYSQVATTGDIKVLLVVDNSPTMQNSQANLNKNLVALLGQIQNYTASVKVISSTMYDPSCNGSNCVSKGTLSYSWSNTSVTVEGRPGGAHSSSLTDSPHNLVFKFEKSMSAAQKQILLDSIRNRVTELGTRGVDTEAQFGSVASQLDSGITGFFKKGDKALIYILTDEDDSNSITALQQPKSSYSESANWNTIEPGLQYFYSAFVTSSATCTNYNEAGVYIGTDFRSPMAFSSAAACSQFLNDSRTSNCNWGSTCTASEALNNFTYPLNGKSISARCAEVADEVKNIHTLTRCVPGDVISWQSISGVNYATYLLGWTKESFATKPRDVILKTVKEKILDLFGSKYLIGVSTNLTGQSCALQTGQSYDTFFTKTLAAELPASNLLITSICDANANDQTLKNIAAEFESIMSNDYLVSLAPSESITEVRAIIGGRSQILKDGVDYTIVSNTFKILSTTLQNFDRIEIQINSHN